MSSWAQVSDLGLQGAYAGMQSPAPLGPAGSYGTAVPSNPWNMRPGPPSNAPGSTPAQALSPGGGIYSGSKAPVIAIVVLVAGMAVIRWLYEAGAEI